ncbi:MAG: SUMF1/EgtB/PvdO family nonheme iron enzyme [Candidatus Brocadiae bacterium]|nr:SUMF1/EgtB/PvdO family nonheme iron enzyme [Candidatus Brocadiia bacterium]
MENIYHYLLGVSPKIKDPNYYELLGIEENTQEIAKIEESYRGQIQKLQKFGNNPKYKETILFLKGELRKACHTLSNSTLRIEYDLVLSEEKVEILEKEIQLLYIKGNLHPLEIQYIQGRSREMKISPVRVEKILRSKTKIIPPKGTEGENFWRSQRREEISILFLLISLAFLSIGTYYYFSKSQNLEKRLQMMETRISSKQPKDLPFVSKEKEIHDASSSSLEKNAVALPKNLSEMIYIPEGEFIMGSEKGSEDEQPMRKIHLDAYYIKRYEVTNQEYQEFIKATQHSIPYLPKKEAEPFNWDPLNKTAPEGKAEYPVVLVTWADAMEYCKWLSSRLQKNVSLPTEAQWEKAARGEKAFFYPWGSVQNGSKEYYANFAAGNTRDKDGFPDLAKVGSFPHGASPYGCMDMAGNVSEWCLDSYDKFAYQEIPSMNPLVTKEEASWPWKVLRGGSWHDSEFYLRTTHRNTARYDQNDIRWGFRYVILIK